MSNSTSCEPCRAGFYCDGLNDPLPCAFASKCLGATCAPGYEKVLCDTCAAHYFSAPGKTCLPCTEQVKANFYLVLSAAIFVILCVLAHSWRNQKFWEAWASDTFSTVSQALIGMHIQRLALLNSLALPFPDIYRRALDWAARIVLNGIVGPECFTDSWTFRSFWTLIVVVVAVLLIGTFLVEFMRELRRQRRGIPGVRLPKGFNDALAETWAKVRNSPRVRGAQFDHEQFPLLVNHFWRGMRLNPLMSIMRFMGAGVLLQVSFKALAYRTIGGVTRQVGDENALYDAPDYFSIKFTSWIVVLLAFAAIAFLTVFRYSITTDSHSAPDGKLREPIKLKCCPMALAIASSARSSTGTPAYSASMEIKVREDPTPWALHIYDMANFASAIAQVPDNVYNSTLGQTISASLLLSIDLAALLLITLLFLRSDVSLSNRRRILLFLVSALTVMTQSVAIWCIKNATSDAGGTCGTSPAATSWGWALTVLNGLLIVGLSGYMTMRVCCCRALYVSRADRSPSPCCFAVDFSVDPNPSPPVLQRTTLCCGGVEDECCCSFGGPRSRFCCAYHEAPDDSAKRRCPQCCWRGRRCGGSGPPSRDVNAFSPYADTTRAAVPMKAPEAGAAAAATAMASEPVLAGPNPIWNPSKSPVPGFDSWVQYINVRTGEVRYVCEATRLELDGLPPGHKMVRRVISE